MSTKKRTKSTRNTPDAATPSPTGSAGGSRPRNRTIVSAKESTRAHSIPHSGAIGRENRRQRLDKEMAWKTEIELRKWFDDYMPGDEPPASVRFDPFDVELGNKEEHMYPGLRNGLSSMLTAVGCTDLEATMTYRHPDSSTSGPLRDPARNVLRPDLGIYPKAQSSSAALDTSATPSTGSDAVTVASDPVTVPSGAATVASDAVINDNSSAVPAVAAAPAISADTSSSPTAVSWDRAELMIEVKYGSATTSYANKYPLLGSAQDRGQIVDYVAEVFNRQHRLFIFMIAFVHDYACFLRFDRTGVAVSKNFSYQTNPEIVGKFLYRFSRMSREERGRDPTVSLASAEEHDLFRNLSTSLPYGLESAVGKGLSEAADRKWPVYKVTIVGPFSPDRATAVLREDPVSTRGFLIGKPTSLSRSLTGRGTRGYVAYDLSCEDVVFIKDSWRPESDDIRSEYDTYLHLRSTASNLQLLRIPTVLGGGDVTFDGNIQRTSAPVQDGVLPRVHFRLVMKEVCRKLEDFRHSYELVMALSWACFAHYKAWTECNVLHRDISVGNILIYEETPGSTGVGLLADWDLAKTKEEVENYQLTQNTRSGTWPFMSARLQHSGIDSRHELADDLESIVHVLNWCCLKYLPHLKSDTLNELADYISTIYDHVDVGAFPEKGSMEKWERIATGQSFITLLNTKQPLQQLLTAFTDICKQHYFHIQFLPERNKVSKPALQSAAMVAPPPIVFPIAESSLPSSPQTVQVSATPDPERSPLRTHEAMMTAFSRALDRELQTEEWPLDKIPGRDLVVGLRRKFRSGSLLASSPPVSGSPDLDSRGSRSKRLKTSALGRSRARTSTPASDDTGMGEESAPPSRESSVGHSLDIDPFPDHTALSSEPGPSMSSSPGPASEEDEDEMMHSGRSSPHSRRRYYYDVRRRRSVTPPLLARLRGERANASTHSDELEVERELFPDFMPYTGPNHPDTPNA